MEETRKTAAIYGCGGVLAGAAFLAYSVRGRSAQTFGPSIYRGPRDRRAVALTFDDGPSEGTPRVLDMLHRYGAKATFFECGVNVRRLPAVARQVVAAGHEIGNHSDTHTPLYLRSAGLILSEFERAQRTMEDTLGVQPRWLRAPFGTRWFGFRGMQRRLGLQGVMWTIIGRDWVLDAAGIARRVLAHVANGSIICLHDGRALLANPDINPTIEALGRIIPELQARGYRISTVSDLVGRENQLCPTN
jgi:peptidoglycan/xylan/chitin deacetylase (PgdA/CDA1 family)